MNLWAISLAVICWTLISLAYAWSQLGQKSYKKVNKLRYCAEFIIYIPVLCIASCVGILSRRK